MNATENSTAGLIVTESTFDEFLAATILENGLA